MCSAVLLSTLGIYASDKLQGIDSKVTTNKQGGSGCGEGMVPTKVNAQTLCVDVYEASPSEVCPHTTLTNILQSEENVNTKGCGPVSKENATPWNFISLPQAQRVCASVGKRLPTNEEWYTIALGTNVEQCIISSSGVEKTGSVDCLSSTGVSDAVGNVWEWVDENVIGNTLDGRTLPQEGYVTSVDAHGIAITTGQQSDMLYGNDYFWSGTEGVFGMIRGGFYGSGADAGLYTANASVPTSFATQGVGFRCVEDIL